MFDEESLSRLTRYESLFELSREMNTASEIARVGDLMASRLKYVADVFSWRYLSIEGERIGSSSSAGNVMIIDGYQGKATVTNVLPDHLSSVECELWAKRKTGFLAGETLAEAKASLPKQFQRSDILHLYVCPHFGGGELRGLSMFSRRRQPLNELDIKFITLAAQFFHEKVYMLREQRRLRDLEQAYLQQEMMVRQQELQTAQSIQRALLPKDVPALSGWQLMPFYRPARVVGGDLYDFIPFEDGRLGIVIGDVTDKGIPAALIMATTCTMLRTAARVTDSPGEVLARVNDLLYAETPSSMFVTCFYAILDPCSGRLHYANAGQNLPCRRQADEVCELRARGMPLGLMPAMAYEEQEVILAPGEYILFYSDGLVEAHNPRREMFGSPRLKTLLAEHADWESLIDFLLTELKGFTGEVWEQEDDVTLVTLQRTQTP